MKRALLLLIVLFSFLGCKKDAEVSSEVAEIPMDVTIERFDIAFNNTKPEGLAKLKEGYPFLFSNRYDDSFWVSQINDSLQKDLRNETAKVFKDFKTEKEEITLLFKHLKYLYPNFKTPRVVTATSSVDYRNKVIVTDTICLISLDTYLGSDHRYYQGLQKYIAKNLKREQIVVDLASEYAKKAVHQSKRRNLLDEMIYYGKQLYYKDNIIPFKTDAEKIGYSEEEYQWSKANEESIWRYFIERELLFNTDSKLLVRFIKPAPFSKFYLEIIDGESPGRIGQFMGWQIIKSYAENNKSSLEEIMLMDAELLYKRSKYKPKK